MNKTLHDINDYLTVVLGCVEITLNKYPLATRMAEAKEYLGKAIELVNTLFVEEEKIVLDKGIAILLADDEYFVLKILKEMLIDIGYSVETAADGDEALEIFSKNPQRYALVILDVAMPRKNGVSTFIAMKQIDKDIPIIMISGYIETILSQQLAGLELAGFLQKPIFMSDLYGKVKEILNNNQRR